MLKFCYFRVFDFYFFKMSKIRGYISRYGLRTQTKQKFDLNLLKMFSSNKFKPSN